MTDQRKLEQAAALLEKSSQYRVLRKLVPRAEIDKELTGDVLIGIILDVETTGLDIELDEIIELAMVKFTFNREGKIGRILDTFQAYNEPENGVPEFISQLTGITNQQVLGQAISKTSVIEFISESVLIIAHNAIFDRPFSEKLVAEFAQYPWACSATEIGWRDEGIVGSRLEYIAQSFGFFFDAHRAADDCQAVFEVLTFVLPKSRKLAFRTLLENARRIETRIFAAGAPFEARGPLKKRGYHWNGIRNEYPRAWWKDVDESEVENEIAFLRRLDENILPELFTMTARNRFRA